MSGVRLVTPCCSRTLRPATFMRSATIVVLRTCPKCRLRYTVKVVPLGTVKASVGAIAEAHIHKVEWTPNDSKGTA